MNIDTSISISISIYRWIHVFRNIDLFIHLCGWFVNWQLESFDAIEIVDRMRVSLEFPFGSIAESSRRFLFLLYFLWWFGFGFLLYCALLPNLLKLSLILIDCFRLFVSDLFLDCILFFVGEGRRVGGEGGEDIDQGEIWFGFGQNWCDVISFWTPAFLFLFFCWRLLIFSFQNGPEDHFIHFFNCETFDITSWLS